MSTSLQLRHYAFHGHTIAVTAPPTMAAAVHARLRHFSADVAGPPDIMFEFSSVDSAQKADNLAQSQSRVVYESSLGRVRYADTENRLFIHYGDHVVAECDPARGYVHVQIPPSEADKLWLISHPMLTIPLMECLKQRGQYGVHAASLAIDGKCLLFPGTSGAGKSTLAIALARAGFGFMGDDMVFLQQDEQSLKALAFPDEIDVTDQTTEMFPELRYLLSQPRPTGWHKRQFRIEDVFGSEIVPACTPGAVIFPQISSMSQSTLKPIDPGSALMELAPNVLLTEARSSQAHLNAIAELVRNSACYLLATGRDFEVLPHLVRDAIR